MFKQMFNVDRWRGRFERSPTVLNGRRPGYEIPENVEIWAISRDFT